MSQSSSGSGAGNPWADVWLDAQKKYMDAWADMARDAGGRTFSGLAAGGPETDNPLAAGFEMWRRMLSSGVPDEARESTERLLAMNQRYLKLGETVWSLMQGAQQAMKAGEQWQEAFQDNLRRFQESVSASFANNADASAGMATFWGMPLQHWRQLSSSLSVMPGDVEKALRADGPVGPETLQRSMRAALSTPTFGYTREWQEDLQEWGRHWLEHARAVQRYEGLFVKVSNRAMELVGERIMAKIEAGESFASLREAYDLIVDCGEEAYGELAYTAEFAEAQTRLTNTLMALKHHEQTLMVEVQSAFNIPTRRELNTSHSRVHDLRREVRDLQHQVDDLELEELRELVAGLREEVRALKAGSASGDAPAAAPVRKAAPKKAAPRKKAAAATPKTPKEK